MFPYCKLNQNVYFSVVCHKPSGGVISAADATPWYRVERMSGSSPVEVTTGFLAADSVMAGRYNGYFYTSSTLFSENNSYQVWVSGRVDGVADILPVKSFYIKNYVDSNMVQVSGAEINGNDFYSNLYYANIKFNKDTINSRDEYTVNWFKNNQPLSSGNFSNPALTVYNTSTGAALFSNQKLTYASLNLGVVRYNDAVNVTASGEAYLVVASSLIDGASRRWEQIIGIDSL